jgi:hypothetical protein
MNLRFDSDVKLHRQLRIGKIEHFDLDLFRRDIEPVARRLIELCGLDWFSKLCAEVAENYARFSFGAVS